MNSKTCIFGEHFFQIGHTWAGADGTLLLNATDPIPAVPTLNTDFQALTFDSYVSQMQTFDWPHLRGYGYGLGVRTMCAGKQKEFGWGGAAGATVLIDSDEELAMFYAHHMLNPQEGYYQPRIRDILYDSMKK